MPELPARTDDRRLRNHFNIDKKRRTNRHKQSAPHLHSYYEMYYLLDGHCRFFLGNRVYRLGTGDLLIIPPEAYHMCSYEEKGIHERFALYFDEQRLAPSLSPFIEYLPSAAESARQYHVRKSGQSDLILMLNRLLEYYRSLSPFGDEMLEHLIPLFLLFLSRNLEAPAAEDEADHPYRALESAADFIAKHFMEPLTLEEAAKAAGFTPSYFSRKFKEVAGIGFRDYLTHLRIKEATRLLDSTSLSIQEISQQCGFSSSNYFGDVFRSVYHVSPSEYRRMQDE